MYRKHYIKDFKRFITLYLFFILGIMALNAQVNPNTYYQCGWQFDFPIKSDFSNKMNDLGLYVDAGYYFTNNISLGGFINVNTQYDDVTRNVTNDNTSTSENIEETLSYISVPLEHP